MKKHVIIFFMILIVGSNLFSYFGRDYVQADGPVVIPKEAIRLRILANSDSDQDQALKRLVRDEVNKNINTWVKDITTIEEGRKVIQDHVPAIQKIVKQTLQEQGSNLTFTVEYKKQVSFPTKMYGEFVYPAGEYEAILITLGKAEGANWWCVLFPPLCFLDFSNGDAIKKVEASNSSESSQEESLPVDKKEIKDSETKTISKNVAKTDKKSQISTVKTSKLKGKPLSDMGDNVGGDKEVKEENKVEVHFLLKDLFELLF